eukprot:gene3500-6148_t
MNTYWQQVFGNVEKYHIELNSKTEKTPIPEKLYSPIKYTLNQQLKLILEKDCNLLYVVQLVNSKTNEEIFKNGKRVLQGCQSYNTLIYDGSTDDFTAKEKLQITDCTYHHGAKFVLKISYFISVDIINPIAVIASPPFDVYARKPTATEKKRKRETNEETKDGKRLTTKKNNLEKFRSLLDELVKCKEGLSQEEKTIAIDELKMRIEPIDDTLYFEDVFTNLEFESLLE